LDKIVNDVRVGVAADVARLVRSEALGLSIVLGSSVLASTEVEVVELEVGTEVVATLAFPPPQAQQA
jgi:hypothetical protein